MRNKLRQVLQHETSCKNVGLIFLLLYPSFMLSLNMILFPVFTVQVSLKHMVFGLKVKGKMISLPAPKMIKMRGHMTSHYEWFRRYESLPRNVKISSIIHENDVITSGILYVPKTTSKKEHIHVKSSQKTSLLKICMTDVLIHSTNALWQLFTLALSEFQMK